ncbi:rep protein [Mycobacteroides immunogenum]|uniref:rep protein n=1 Tax=Mycobacteroides immunogenum TaxID=83262 RepID=UPI001F2C2480|nr:rep protein [Mycobacteroides immunogenum]
MARNQCANRDFFSTQSARVGSAWPTPLGTANSSSPHVVRALSNERRRGWVERAGACVPRAPMWSSRASWLDGLQRWAQSPALAQLCTEQRVSITAATLVSVAAVMAEHADHATGRHVAVTRATIAARVGCDVRTVTAAWRVLRASQWAVEAQRGHGSPGTPSIGRRPSVYHLVPRRDPRPPRHRPVQEPVHDFHLPPSGGVSSFSPVGSYSPSGRASAPAHRSPGKGFKTRAVRPPRRTTPRPLATQRLAAALVAATHGLDRAHIGTICDALTAAGIDPAVWTARAITTALNAEMRARGTTWPDHIANPGAFLSSRLRRLNWSSPERSTPKDGGCAAASIDHTPPPVPLTDESRARIAAAQQEIRRVLRDRAHHTAHQNTLTRTSPTPPAATTTFQRDTSARYHRLPAATPGSAS